MLLEEAHESGQCHWSHDDVRIDKNEHSTARSDCTDVPSRRGSTRSAGRRQHLVRKFQRDVSGVVVAAVIYHNDLKLLTRQVTGVKTGKARAQHGRRPVRRHNDTETGRFGSHARSSR